MPRTLVLMDVTPLTTQRPRSSVWLREATTREHRAVERAIAVDEIRTHDDLVALLTGWHDVWHAAELAARRSAAGQVAQAYLLWPAAAAVCSLRADLASLGFDPRSLQSSPSHTRRLAALLEDDAAAWGVAYVLLGSRLDNTVVASRLRATLALRDDCCTEFLQERVPNLRRDWNAFRDRLDAAELDPDALGGPVDAARLTFHWMGAAIGGRLASPPETERWAA
jgi:heme oxygenase